MLAKPTTSYKELSKGRLTLFDSDTTPSVTSVKSSFTKHNTRLFRVHLSTVYVPQPNASLGSFVCASIRDKANIFSLQATPKSYKPVFLTVDLVWIGQLRYLCDCPPGRPTKLTLHPGMLELHNCVIVHCKCEYFRKMSTYILATS